MSLARYNILLPVSVYITWTPLLYFLHFSCFSHTWFTHKSSTEDKNRKSIKSKSWQLQFVTFLNHCGVTSLMLFDSYFPSVHKNNTREEKEKNTRKSNSHRQTNTECCLSTSCHHWTGTVMSYHLSSVWCSAAAVGKGVIPQGNWEPGKKLFPS